MGDQLRHFLITAPGVTLAEGEDTIEVHLLPYGSYTHPLYGEIDIDQAMVSDMVKNFDAGVRGTDLDIDYAHKSDQAKGDKAAGWIRALSQKVDGLWGAIKFTGEALTEIKDGAWKYMSVDYSDEWCNNASPPVCFPNVLFGAALTNRPFMKNLSPIINFSEMFDVPPGKVEKEDAHYRMADDSMWRCTNCVFFRDGTCLVVDGEIDGDFTSNFFQPIRNDILDKMYTEVLEDGTVVHNVHVEVPEEEVKHMHEFLQKILEALGKTDVKVEEGKEEEAVEVALQAISETSTQLEEVRSERDELKSKTGKKLTPAEKKFAEDYPEQAAQLAEQAVQLKENAIDRVLSEHKRIPPAAHELLRPLMRRFSDERMTEMDAVLEAIESKGLVTLGEVGTTQVDDGQGDVTERFAAAVKKLQDENEGMSFKEAVTQVSYSDPELATEYRKSIKPAEAMN